MSGDFGIVFSIWFTFSVILVTFGSEGAEDLVTLLTRDEVRSTTTNHQRQKAKSKKQSMEKRFQVTLHGTVVYRNIFHHERCLGADLEPINRVGGCSSPLPRRKVCVFHHSLYDTARPSSNIPGSYFSCQAMVLGNACTRAYRRQSSSDVTSWNVREASISGYVLYWMTRRSGMMSECVSDVSVRLFGFVRVFSLSLCCLLACHVYMDR
jgi:hypothetical protein